MPSKVRPIGVTLVAFAFFGVAAIFAHTGILLALAPDLLVPRGFRAGPSPALRLLGLVAFGGVGALCGHLGWGLRSLRPFARSYTVSLGSLGIAACLLRLVSGSTEYPTLAMAGTLCGALVVYFSLPSIRAAFAAPPDVSAVKSGPSTGLGSG